MPLLVAPRSSHGVALVDHQPLYRLQPPRSGSVELEHQSSPPPPPPPEGNGVAAPPARAADSAVDFSMSKFKASSRHSLYRQFYGGDESPPYEKPTEETEPAEPEGREKSFGK
uniref:Uncharacterized protein n=3 Tax=Anopheles merus TaxID=30066 RepID=A0A182VFH2_ANOME